MLFAGLSYFTNQMAIEGFQHLGFPGYFRIELGTAKILGVIALILPWIPSKIKEFAYFGFTITFASALIAHVSSGDPVNVAIRPVIAFVILAVSYIYYSKIEKKQ
jgi:hypothetical protein